MSLSGLHPERTKGKTFIQAHAQIAQFPSRRVHVGSSHRGVCLNTWRVVGRVVHVLDDSPTCQLEGVFLEEIRCFGIGFEGSQTEIRLFGCWSHFYPFLTEIALPNGWLR